MDVIVLGIELTVPVAILLLSLRGRKASFAVFPLMASIIPVFSFLGLGADGDLTTISNGTTAVIASAASSSWTGVLLMPLFVIIVCLGFGAAKAVRMI